MLLNCEVYGIEQFHAEDVTVQRLFVIVSEVLLYVIYEGLECLGNDGVWTEIDGKQFGEVCLLNDLVLLRC